jgi:hypothetical protein
MLTKTSVKVMEGETLSKAEEDKPENIKKKKKK